MLRISRGQPPNNAAPGEGAGVADRVGECAKREGAWMPRTGREHTANVGRESGAVVAWNSIWVQLSDERPLNVTASIVNWGFALSVSACARHYTISSHTE